MANWPLPALLAAILCLTAACSSGGADAPPPTATPAATLTPAATTTPTTPAPTPTSTGATSPAPATGFPRLGTSAGVPVTQQDPTFQAIPGAKAYFGQLGKSVYRIEMPNQWNGDLVLWAHGFRGIGTLVIVDNPPEALRKAFIEQGYAWAASSYDENGYTPGIGADSTLALKRYFETKFAKPRRTYLVGASMGGNVAVLSLEHFAGEYSGALSMCGAVTGQEQIDYLISWAAVAEATSAITLPIGAGQAAMLETTSRIQNKLKANDSNPPIEGQRFISVIRELTGGPRPFFLEGLRDQYSVNFGLLLLDPNRTTLIGRAATNEGVTYAVDPALGLDAAALNAAIRRFIADPAARNAEAHPDAVPTSGNLTAPLLTIHGTGDLFVPISLEISYLAKAIVAGKGDLLVQRAIRASGHCNFTAEELTTTWNDLVAWVSTGAKPAGDDLSGDLSEIGTQFTTPLRPGDPGGP